MEYTGILKIYESMKENQINKSRSDGNKILDRKISGDHFFTAAEHI